MGACNSGPTEQKDLQRNYEPSGGGVEEGRVLENRPDKAATKAMQFASAKSFVSFVGHIYLYGVRDHAVMREALWLRSKGRCEGCKTNHLLNPESWQWHHTQKTLGGRRCDGLCCALAVCEAWHTKHHNRQTRFGEGRGESAES